MTAAVIIKRQAVSWLEAIRDRVDDTLGRPHSFASLEGALRDIRESAIEAVENLEAPE